MATTIHTFSIVETWIVELDEETTVDDMTAADVREHGSLQAIELHHDGTRDEIAEENLD